MTRLIALAALILSFTPVTVRASEDFGGEFTPSDPLSEFLPAVAGEPPVDFCAQWNPEFAYRGYRCCGTTISRGLASASSGRRSRRRASSCAPNRIKWTFCDEMTPAQKEYVSAVKSGKIDALDHISKSMGSRGGQAFCGAGNGFLVEGRPLVPTENNRIELRNEARCANFGTDPMVGAFEWVGREIKKEYHEAEFKQARLIIGDIAAPRGGCISGRGGRRAHKSHTTGIDIDLAYFNAHAGQSPEERFTRTFFVASNWWFLKKLMKNPFSCVKVIFLDRSHIRALERYAKEDPEWNKYKRFIRHVRGHRDHFHVRMGNGPGVAGCSGDPSLEEDEDVSDESDDGFLVKEDEDSGSEVIAEEAATVDGKTAGPEALRTLASGVEIAETTLPPHKLEPKITAKFAEKKSRRTKRKARTTASHRAKRHKS